MDIVTSRRTSRKRQRQTATSDRDSFEFRGGLNLVDPPLTIKPGFCLAGLNYEIGIQGGYERLGAFERFDGRAAPSDTAYYLIPVRYDRITSAMQVVGETISATDVGETFQIIKFVPLTEPGINQTINSYTGGSSQLTLNLLPAPPTVPLPSRTYVDGLQLSGGTGNSASKFLAPPRPLVLTEKPPVVENRHFRAAIVGPGAVAIGDQAFMGLFFRQKDAERRYLKCVARGTFPTIPIFGVNEAVIDLQKRVIVSTVGDVEWSLDSFDYGHGWVRVLALTPPATVAATLLYFEASLMETAVSSGNGRPEQYPGVEGLGFYTGGAQAEVKNGEQPKITPYRSTTGVELNLPSGVGYFLATNLSGTLAVSGAQGDLEDADGTVFGENSGPERINNALSLEDHLDALRHVANAQRELIEALPGGGPVRGVWLYNGNVYGFRDDAEVGATVCKMFKSTPAGWVEITFAPHLNFDAGLAAGEAAVIEGATITGATSGATATIERVNVTNPSWSSSAAIGVLVLSGVTGTFQNNESLEIGATPVATAEGVVYTPTWDDGGRYRFRTHNFYGASDLKRMYGVNGLNRVFEFDDGDGVLASYRTGMVNDAPNHLAIHQSTLFLSFKGGSIQKSGVGRPGNWTVVAGAAEIGLGDDCTGFLEEIGSSLFIFTRNKKFQLIGNVADGYKLDPFDPNNGALENSIQRIGIGIHLDDRGFASLPSSDKYGNYEANTFSRLIQPIIDRKLKSTTVTESVIFRRRNRYRCFFADGDFISIGVSGQKVTGHMVCNYTKVVRCACSEEDSTGIERIFFGSDDGYIYEAERGTSFDGSLVRAGLRPAYHHSGRPEREKHYRSGRIEAILDGKASVYVTPGLSFGKTVLSERDISATVGGAIWDHTMEWEGFFWDRVIEPLQEFRIESDGINIGLSIRHESDSERPHTLRAMVYQTSMRNLKRRAAVG